MLRIAIVDDNRFLREQYLQRLSDRFEVVLETANAYELIQYMESVSTPELPKLVLMDIEMDDLDGIAATVLVKSKFPEVKVVMLTVFGQDEKVWQSIMAGADGYIVKDESKDKVISAIEDTIAGGAYMSPAIARKAMTIMQQGLSFSPAAAPSDDYELTRREKEILTLVTEGLSYKQIAAQLFISVSTAKTHIHHIYAKLQVRNKIEAARKIKHLG